MTDVKKKKMISIVLSLLIALACWFYVINGENPTQTEVFTNIPVEMLNAKTLESKDLTIGAIDTTTVSVKLEGKRSALRSIKREDIVASIDMSSYTEGEYYSEVRVHVPSSVSVVEINPAQIRVKIEKIVSVDKDIEILFEGSVPDKKEAVCTGMSTQIVAISGAQSQVNLVEKVIAKVDATQLSETEATFASDLTPVDSSGAEVNDVTVAIKDFTCQAQLYSVKTVPLEVTTVGSLPHNLELASIIAPESVKIAGIESDVADITKVKAVPIDLSEITSSKDIPIILDISGSIRLAKSQNATTIQVTVNKMDNRNLSYATSSIILKNIGDGHTIVFDAQSISLTVYGTGTALEEIGTQDFTMSIDCSKLTSGTHEVPVDVAVSQTAASEGISVDKPVVKLHVS
ncbi:MAG: hypothetical protein IKV96_02000 [Firmicutes bacterium]|nr:hypothetical protein [Bacillota bacterium]